MKKHTSLFLLTFFLFSCAGRPPVREPVEPVKAAEPEKPEEIVTDTEPQPDYLTIIAAGDNLCHDVMIRAGEEGDYQSFYSEIRPLVEKADIAFINQETVLAGEDFGFSGYPRFNTPREVGRALADAGFDVVNHATNHIMDKGEAALAATLDFWSGFEEISVLGIHRSEEERKHPVLVTKNNITAGFLSYTYGTNGLPVPKDKPYLVSLIDTETMARELNALRPLCDVLVVSMHWGEEYFHTVSEKQKTLAAFLAEHKVDLVLGHHPHVVQPVEQITRPDGKNMLCFYSLGNLISAQTRNPTLLGALGYVKIEKTAATDNTGDNDEKNGNIVFVETGAIPVVTHYERGYTNFKIYPLYAYTTELSAKHGKNAEKEELTKEYLSGIAEKVLNGSEILQNPLP